MVALLVRAWKVNFSDFSSPQLEPISSGDGFKANEGRTLDGLTI